MSAKTTRESTEAQRKLRRILFYVVHCYPDEGLTFSLIARALYEETKGNIPRKERGKQP